MGGNREGCGRCAMSTVVDAVDGDGDGSGGPFDGARIELSDAELRAASPAAWLEGLKRRVDELAARVAYKTGR